MLAASALTSDRDVAGLASARPKVITQFLGVTVTAVAVNAFGMSAGRRAWRHQAPQRDPGLARRALFVGLARFVASGQALLGLEPAGASERPLGLTI